ncbi:LysR family transcriptional regulator [Pigmentiphaga litoralis]|uniref:LysR family transcriptional regulator n=1 Tax=Pigmentiphaga litoralis TaxID=516702 RepID=UPI003B439CD2
MQLNSRQLRAFLLVAQQRNFSRAADLLGVTQSGLSVLIRDLETQIGFRLFDRTTRHVSLTEFGAEFHPVVERTLADLESAVHRIARSASTQERCLTIGATQFMSTYVMPAAIAEFNASSRGVQARLVDSDRANICPLVESGKLDMAVGIFLRPGSGVQGAPLVQGSFSAVRAGRSSKRGKAIPWSDLAHETLILLPDDNPIQQRVNEQLSRIERGHADLVFNHIETQVAMAETGAGVAVVPSLALPAFRRRKIQVQALIDPIVPLEIWQIWNGAGRQRDDMATFTDFLKRYIADWAG